MSELTPEKIEQAKKILREAGVLADGEWVQMYADNIAEGLISELRMPPLIELDNKVHSFKSVMFGITFEKEK